MEQREFNFVIPLTDTMWYHDDGGKLFFVVRSMPPDHTCVRCKKRIDTTMGICYYCRHGSPDTSGGSKWSSTS